MKVWFMLCLAFVYDAFTIEVRNPGDEDISPGDEDISGEEVSSCPSNCNTDERLFTDDFAEKWFLNVVTGVSEAFKENTLTMHSWCVTKFLKGEQLSLFGEAFLQIKDDYGEPFLLKWVLFALDHMEYRQLQKPLVCMILGAEKRAGDDSKVAPMSEVQTKLEGQIEGNTACGAATIAAIKDKWEKVDIYFAAKKDKYKNKFKQIGVDVVKTNALNLLGLICKYK